eukprot:Opistho-2@86543
MRDRMKELKAAAAEQGNIGQQEVVVPPEEANYMGSFLYLMTEIKGNIRQIETRVQALAERHASSLSAYSEAGTKSIQAEVDKLTTEIQLLANGIRIQLKDLDQQNKESIKSHAQAYAKRLGLPSPSENEIPKVPLPPDLRIRENQQTQLSRHFVNIMSEYNDIQLEFKDKSKERIRRQYKIAKPDASEEEIENAMGSTQNGNIFAKQVMSTSLVEARKALEDAQDRQKDLEKLEEGLRELHALFLDMAMIISAHGKMVDSIADSVEQAAEYVEEGAEQTQVAHKEQKKFRKKKIAIAVACLVLLLILVLALALR